MKTSFRGFTLIELLIVIVIIGILAISLISKIIGMKDRAKITRVERDFQIIQTAVFMAHINTKQNLKQIT